MTADGAASLTAVVAVLIAGALSRYEERRRADRAAGAPPNTWERPATLGRVTMAPGAWVIFWLLALILLTIVVRALESVGL